MAADEIVRVRYFERQFLGADDFRAEQTYDRDARRRHVLAEHTWGIVAGLRVRESAPGPAGFVDVTLTPGVAIDGFGRELVGYHPRQLDAELFSAFHAEGHHTVWIGYREESTGAARSGWADCQDAAATRITESWRIAISPPSPETDDIIVDGAVAADPPADTSVPWQELPEGPPGDRWLIYVGIVHWDGVNQRFLPVDAAVAQSAPPRRYAGAVADHVLSPDRTLAIRRRRALETVDEEDFATVEGRLRVKERINAERDVWLEGHDVRFAYDNGDEDGVHVTLGRQRPASAPLEHELRLRMGGESDKVALSIGPGEAANAKDVLRVAATDVVSIPTGTLRFGQTKRQMVDLWTTDGAHEYGVGVQSAALYMRSGGAFCWFKGGVHEDTEGDPGANGQLQMRLDGNGDLHFGARVRQMLNLWSTNYGIGVQDWTLYFRADADFCWYRGGQHANGQNDGGGGALAMRLDGSSSLHVFGDLHVHGQSQSVVKVWRYEGVIQNSGTAPGTWTVDVAGEFSQVYESFVVLNGFSVWNQSSTAFDHFDHLKSTNVIVQHAYARVSNRTGTSITVEAFCQESDETLESDNSVLFTLVVIGRTTA